MTEGTYTNPDLDRSGWPPGPWDDEPDKVSWTDETTGLPCLAVRARDNSGGWCGYVAVEPGHPLHGTPADELPAGIGAHGWALDFAGSCDETSPVERSICHIPEPGRPADVWWFGFHCGHAFDIQPGYYSTFPELARLYDKHNSPELEQWTYRTLSYVKGECAALASQLARNSTRTEHMLRTEHMKWVKERALAELEPGGGGVETAMASIQSDLTKHPETAGHGAILESMMLFLAGDLRSATAMRKYINNLT